MGMEVSGPFGMNTELTAMVWRWGQWWREPDGDGDRNHGDDRGWGSFTIP